MRILYSSNAFWASSGYGTQGKSLLPRLAELEIVGGRQNVAMFAWWGLQGGIHQVEGFTVYPAGMDNYGNDIIGAHANNFRADVVITLIDAWVQKDIQAKVAPAIYVPWFPVDHEPVPAEVLRGISDSKFPVTYSLHGQRQLKEAGVDAWYIPHGIETESYFVHQEREQVENFKREVLKADDFLAVMVAANKGYPDRKGLQQQLAAFAQFVHNNNPKAKLYIHSESGTRYGGMDLPALISHLGIEQNVMFPDSYANFVGLPSEYLNMVYNSADVLLNASMGEGFGIPIIEAQSAGTRVIVSDFTSMPELVRKGFAVKPLDKFWTPMNSYQCIPNTKGIYESLVRISQANFGIDQQVELQNKIHGEFDWNEITKNYWEPFLKTVNGENEEVPEIKEI